MNKDTIIDRMQSYFSGENQNPEFDTSIEMDALQLFYVRTAKRLVLANELQNKDTIYRDDFFIALRDYLLVFETSLSLSKNWYFGRQYGNACMEILGIISWFWISSGYVCYS